MAETNLYIIEGVTGSGKTTVLKNLCKQLKGKNIYSFEEDLLLCSWKHQFLDLDKLSHMRIDIIESMLDLYNKTVKKDKNAVFILIRFHITYKLYSPPATAKLKERYNNIIKSLRSKPVKVIVPVLDEKDLEKRCAHAERSDALWKKLLKDLMELKGYESYSKMFLDEQTKIKKILDEQKIPYEFISVNLQLTN